MGGEAPDSPARPAGPRGPSPRLPTMTPPLRRTRSVAPSVLVAVLALSVVGCGSEEGVTSYRVPKTPESTRKDGPAAAGEYRMLGLMVPADDPAWFFKF